MKIVVGLGNPGPEYERSRHNAGFMVVDRVAEQHHLRFNQKRAQSRVARGLVGHVEVVLAKPQTYMNLSGHAVQGLLMIHRVKPRDLLVVYDDFDLPLGSLRLRERGSAGTHNGLRSIVAVVGTQDFPRLRLGIGSPSETSASEHVLSDFDADSWAAFEQERDRAAEAVRCFLLHGAATTMNRYNG